MSCNANYVFVCKSLHFRLSILKMMCFQKWTIFKSLWRFLNVNKCNLGKVKVKCQSAVTSCRGSGATFELFAGSVSGCALHLLAG